MRAEEVGLAAEIIGESVLEHAPVPFVSYPYEWSFDMLRDAALLTLELMRRSLEKGFILKDASPYNIQFINERPVFIDLMSFELLRPGTPWIGYSQFCQTFLFPLMLTAYRQFDFQAVLRGSLEGVKAEDMAKLLGWSSIHKPGVFTHVKMQALLAKHLGGELPDLRPSLGEAVMSAKSIARLIAKLERLIQRLRCRPASSWLGYSDAGFGDFDFRERKLAFVSEFLARGCGVVWDLGCNTGEYSNLAARSAKLVVAMDADPWCINKLYLDQKAGRAAANVLRLVMDFADPSPALGWRLEERSSWLDRGRPDAVILLALIHHLVISRNIPVGDLIRFVRSLAKRAVVEFVTKDDPMVQRLLLNREDVFADYTVARFEGFLSESFAVRGTESNARGTRILYHLEATD
jgi:hypothetical protein